MKKNKAQEIEIGNERAAIVPLETWTKLLEHLEELEDERFFDEASPIPIAGPSTTRSSVEGSAAHPSATFEIEQV